MLSVPRTPGQVFEPVHLARATGAAVEESTGIHDGGTDVVLVAQEDDHVIEASGRSAPAFPQQSQVGVVRVQHGKVTEVGVQQFRVEPDPAPEFGRGFDRLVHADGVGTDADRRGNADRGDEEPVSGHSSLTQAPVDGFEKVAAAFGHVQNVRKLKIRLEQGVPDQVSDDDSKVDLAHVQTKDAAGVARLEAPRRPALPGRTPFHAGALEHPASLDELVAHRVQRGPGQAGAIDELGHGEDVASPDSSNVTARLTSLTPCPVRLIGSFNGS